jgi:16S rRNA (guanine1207-N2)-methyltransferase
VLNIKSHCRVCAFDKLSESAELHAGSDEYFQTLKHVMCKEDALRQVEYLTKPGVFSYRNPDPGSELLARTLPLCKDQSVMNLACGSGVLGLVAAKLGAASVTCLDNSAIAVKCAEESFRHQLDSSNCTWKVVCLSMYSELEEKYDLVISNPPFHIHKSTCRNLGKHIIRQSKKLLKKNGVLYLVCNSFINHRTTGEENFSTVETVNRSKSYIVYRMSNTQQEI